MEINLKNGIDKLLFGMKQNDVTALYGKPNRNYKDEDNNNIFGTNTIIDIIIWYMIFLLIVSSIELARLSLL